MPTPRWQQGLERFSAKLRTLAASRRLVSATDPAADALDFAAADAEAVVRELKEPTAMLTTEEWAAEQEPPVAGGTARRWCREGALEYVETPKGYLIPAGALRQRKEPPAVLE